MPKVWNGRHTTGFGRGARSRKAGALACGLVCCLAYLVRAQELPPPAAQELRRALQHLPDTLRTAVVMRDIQELSYQEIADRLHLPEGTVKSRINRGRHELARQITRLREKRPGPQADAGQPGRRSGV